MATPFVYVTQHALGTSDHGQDPSPEITPAMREGIQKVKKAIAAKNKGLRLAQSLIKTAHDAFKAQAAPLIASLKAMKREAMLNAKLTEGFREGMRSQRAALMIENQFSKKFHIQNMYASWLGFGRGRRWGWRTPVSLLRRKFRIRI